MKTSCLRYLSIEFCLVEVRLCLTPMIDEDGRRIAELLEPRVHTFPATSLACSESAVKHGGVSFIYCLTCRACVCLHRKSSRLEPGQADIFDLRLSALQARAGAGRRAI